MVRYKSQAELPVDGEIMIKIILPLVAMLALVGCKKKDDDTGSDEVNTEMSEQE